MNLNRSFVSSLAVIVLCASSAQAVNFAISIGIRETGGTGPAFANAGFGGGIEWVNLDGQTLTADGTWQQFSFAPSTDTLTAFAGGSADGVLDPNSDWASLEHIRLLNVDGHSGPITLWIDDVAVTDAAGSVVEGFEGFSVGDEVIFQEPGFSGSTSGNLEAGSAAGVTDGMAYRGAQSYRGDFEFIDNDPTRWVRWTSFQSANLPNPFIHTREPGAPAPTLSFWAKAEAIPEPASVVITGLAIFGLTSLRRRG